MQKDLIDKTPAAGGQFVCPPPTLPYMTFSTPSEEEMGSIPPCSPLPPSPYLPTFSPYESEVCL